MAEKLCQLKKKGKGGGQLKETVLWTNSSPTSSLSSVTLNLLSDISQFDYVKITYRIDTSNSKELSAFWTLTDFMDSADTAGHNEAMFGARFSDYEYARRVRGVTSTTVTLSSASAIYAQVSNTSRVIPLKIIGLKY